MISILIVSFVVYLAYNIIAVIRFSKDKLKISFPSSISETFYFMPHWSFIGFLMISLGSIMTISYMYMDYTGSLNLFSLSNVGALILTGVPAFANMHWKKIKYLHLICAILGFTIISIGFSVDYKMWYWTIYMLVATISVFLSSRNSNSLVWWIEHALIISMLIGYGLLPIWN